MKILAIGDIHGRNCWEKICKKYINEVDKILFIGDYVDSFDIEHKQQLSNLINIINFKKNNLDKVILLLGNHDLHYGFGMNPCDGYQSNKAYVYNIIFQENKHLFQMCYKYNNFLFTHAGVTKTFLLEKKYNNVDIETFLNNLNYKEYFFVHSTKDRYSDRFGNNVYQSPIWVRPESLIKDKIDNFFQIVGHTENDEITYDMNIYFIDCLDFQNQYLLIDDKNVQIIFN